VLHLVRLKVSFHHEALLANGTPVPRPILVPILADPGLNVQTRRMV
jgi:hypothetical protein